MVHLPYELPEYWPKSCELRLVAPVIASKGNPATLENAARQSGVFPSSIRAFIQDCGQREDETKTEVNAAFT